MNSETRQFVVAGIEARLRELNADSRKIGDEIQKYGKLLRLYTKNGATPAESLEKKLAATETLRAKWRASKAKKRAAHRERQAPKQAGRKTFTKSTPRTLAAATVALRSLLTTDKQFTGSLRTRAGIRKGWRVVLLRVRALPEVITEGTRANMTLRLRA